MAKGQVFGKSAYRAASVVVLFCLAWGLIAGAIHALTQDNTLGTDFFIFYHSGQTVFQQEANPYSLELAAENQQAIFKRPAGPGEDQLGFAYPLYALFILTPLLWLPFDWAQAVWAGLLLLSLPAALIWAARRPRPGVAATVIFFYPVTFGLILGNYAVLLGALLLVLYGIQARQEPGRGLQIGGGLALALLSAKPQLTWLFIVFFGLAALRRRQAWLLGSFGISLAVLAGGAFWLRPGWVGEWLAALQAYAAYNQTWPTLTILLRDLLAPEAAAAVTILGGAALGVGTAWLFWRWWKGRLDGLALFAWCGLAIYLVHPHGKSYEHIAYLAPLMMWAGSLPAGRNLPARAFWAGSLAVSWAAFFISIEAGAPLSSTEWPVLFQAGWVAWMVLKIPGRGALSISG